MGVMDMEFLTLAIIAGVFCGNVLTASFIWAMIKLDRITDPVKAPWMVYAALLLPLFVALAVLFLSFGPPESLAAIVAQ